jgi:hypothetical protein
MPTVMTHVAVAEAWLEASAGCDSTGNKENDDGSR